MSEFLEDKTKRFRCGAALSRTGRVYTQGNVQICETWFVVRGEERVRYIVSQAGWTQMITPDKEQARRVAGELVNADTDCD